MAVHFSLLILCYSILHIPRDWQHCSCKEWYNFLVRRNRTETWEDQLSTDRFRMPISVHQFLCPLLCPHPALKPGPPAPFFVPALFLFIHHPSATTPTMNLLFLLLTLSLSLPTSLASHAIDRHKAPNSKTPPKQAQFWSNKDEALHSYIAQHVPDVLEHTGSEAFDAHLKGVQGLLRGWEADEEVVDAGLFHSICECVRVFDLYAARYLSLCSYNHVDVIVSAIDNAFQ